MAALRSRRLEKKDKACLPKGGEIVERKSVFGRYTDSEMLSRIKALALNHSKPGMSPDSIRPLWNQTLRVRKVMSLGDAQFPRRKRKLQQFLKENPKFAAGLASEVSNHQHVAKSSRGPLSDHASSASCMRNMADFVEHLNGRNLVNLHSPSNLFTPESNFQGQPLSSEVPILDSAEESGSPNEDITLVDKPDESVNGSNPVGPEDMTIEDSALKDLDDFIHGSNSLHFEEPKPEHLCKDLDEYSNSLHLDHFQGELFSSELHVLDIVKDCGPPYEDNSLRVDSDLSVNGSNSVNREDMTLEETAPLDVDDLILSSTLLHLEEPNPEHLCKGNFQGQPLSYDLPNNVEVWGLSSEDNSLIVYSDRSVDGSKPASPEIMTVQESPSPGLKYISHISNSLNLDESKYEHPYEPRRSTRLQNFIGDHLQRINTPIGPRFQADLPQCVGSPSKGYTNDSSKWLGTNVWPIEGQNINSTAKSAGKGRPNSCSCLCLGSTDCIKRHILEERLFLQSDLGPAFSTWKFDEMGEEVSRSWTSREQESFSSLARKTLNSRGKNFLKNALKCFPKKCKKDILSYYYNVYIPRCMNLQTRCSSKEVDGDVDAVEDIYNLRKRHKDKTSLQGSCKDVKTSRSVPKKTRQEARPNAGVNRRAEGRGCGVGRKI